jgi:hypothetical protein
MPRRGALVGAREGLLAGKGSGVDNSRSKGVVDAIPVVVKHEATGLRVQWEIRVGRRAYDRYASRSWNRWWDGMCVDSTETEYLSSEFVGSEVEMSKFTEVFFCGCGGRVEVSFSVITDPRGLQALAK